MKSFPSKPSLYLIQGNELPLSGKALVELMAAVLAKGRSFRFRARGLSMAPFIRDRDVICVSPFLYKNPSLGEIVAYVRPVSEKLIVHRLIGRQGNEWLIQGDNTPEEHGELVSKEYLIGRVTSIERDGRKIWLGLGPERYVIALFSRKGALLPLMGRLRMVTKGWLRRVSK